MAVCCAVCSWFQHADTRTQILEAPGSKSDDEAHWRQGPCLRLVQGFGHRITDKEPPILFYKDQEATLCLKEILARFLKPLAKPKQKPHGTAQTVNILRGLIALMLNQPSLNRYQAQEDCFRFSFYPWSAIVCCLLNGKEKMTMVQRLETMRKNDNEIKTKLWKDPGRIFTSEAHISADPMLWFAPANELRRLKPWFLSEKKTIQSLKFVIYILKC